MATLNERIVQLLGPLVGGRIYPDLAPDHAGKPYITYEQTGGRARQYLEKRLPDHRHARIQINVWDDRRTQATAIALQVEKVLIESELVSEALGAFSSVYDQATKLRGTRQDFYFWHRDT
ncbi:DUF3168 domain-containing protein [Delftia sp. DLF01]|uniref:DUF3168 domain-containing protein n=1 Tax=Delftia TaxID=80865 RepID=UPI0007739C59|nr:MULTISPECIES: DUF3168 domain-containing protein [Delftia]MBD9583589.1 DUF3168 domain-containing protein [Delftia sp. DLF01]SFB50917.1 Protein of unknown function [Delftia tsuruhatensis]